MNCQFIKVWAVEVSDGYTSKPVAYFSSKTQAHLSLQGRNAGYYRVNDTPHDAIQVDSEVYLLGQKIDVNHAEERAREALINAAKSKLSEAELAALLGKKLP